MQTRTMPMRKLPMRTLATTFLLATALGGCTMFGSSGQSNMASGDTDLSSYFEERLAAGRAYLKAGLPARAVTAFRQASYDADSAAEAYNGMGVAYAMQGRADVAQRMFGKAVKANPYDERFSRNLARLEKRIGDGAMLAQGEGDTGLQPLQGSVPAPGESGERAAGKELPPVAGQGADGSAEPFTFPRTVTSSGGLSPYTTKVTQITTVDHGAGPDWQGLGGNVLSTASSGSLASADRAPTRNPSVSVYKPSKSYPVRVAITRTKPAVTARAAPEKASPTPGTYPVRVALGSDTDGKRR